MDYSKLPSFARVFLEVNGTELMKVLIYYDYLMNIRRPFEKFVYSPYYSESELYGGAVTVSFSKYLPWQEMHFLQRSTHFSKTFCRPFAASFRRIVEQAVLTFHIRFSVSKALPPLENRSSSQCIVSIGLMDELFGILQCRVCRSFLIRRDT
jgi:hypothetical protein